MNTTTENQDFKISTNLVEVKSLDPCPSGLRDFERMLTILSKRKDKNHVQNHENILFSTCLQHINLEDCFWFLCEVEDQLSKSQIDDLHLLACDYAESCLHLFEEVYPDDKRPRAAIEAKRAWVRGECTDDELEKATRDAAWAARDAARAAWDAARDAWASEAAMAAMAAVRAVRAAVRAVRAAGAAGAAVRAVRAAGAAGAAVSAVRAARDAEQKDLLMQIVNKWEQ